ncbi:MAG TPA: AAA domain-containing protein [Ktedonobacteraceae bacterium]
MATHGMDSAGEEHKACFLCSLDPTHHCHTAQIEGHIITALERTIDGKRTPAIILDTGTERVELQLDDQYYRNFVKELQARGDAISSYSLVLRVHHLPRAPQISEYREHNRYRYQGNAYTLAVLEPDTLLNITDLNQAEYCSRQYLLNRLAPSSSSPATIRGNLVHYCFKELLKAFDPGRTSTPLPASPRDVLYTQLEQALQHMSIDMALANVSVEAMRAEAAPHLDSLANWFEREQSTLWDMSSPPTEQGQQHHNQVRAETFLLAPEVGLRGRLDLFWQQTDRQRLLELKTGGATGELPKRSHRWQVYGYHTLLAVRRDSKMQKALATLLYSGTEQQAQAYGIPSTIREIQRVNEIRNILALSRISGIPSAPPGSRRCTKCSMLNQCQSISTLLDWQPPEPEPQALEQTDAPASNSTQIVLDTAAERDFFTRYYRLLHMEGQAAEQQQALLWKTPMAERIKQGIAIYGLQALEPPTIEKDGWEQTFRCTNTSELREGDEILLSDGSPISGEVVSGTIIAINSERVTVWTRETIAHPMLIDRYNNDLVHVRTLQNLQRWLQAEPHLRDLVTGKIRPRFKEQHVPPRSDFNREQNIAVERAIQMQDYLLIQGPPGTGKTSVIAEIVRQLTQQGQRVMLAAFTNQAVDNMLKRLDHEGLHDYVRLGHERSVEEQVRTRLLQRALQGDPGANPSDDATAQFPALVRDKLRSTPVVASTTATWSSDRYALFESKAQSGSAIEDTGLHFDVAIIDEAGQLTVPAILGALRFARRFILVGDEKQLPPLVLSKEASEQGLSTALFETLKSLDTTYIQQHTLAMSACVSLRVQYRMNQWISHFSSTVFYEKELIAHPSVAHQQLKLKKPDSFTPSTRAILDAIKPGFPLVFLDVQAGSIDEESQHIKQKANDHEAQAVRELVAALLAHGIEPQDIGIIAPYRAQVANIRRYLFSNAPEMCWQALPVDSPLNVDTVDRFQGGERMIIILSFVSMTEPGEEDPRREFLTNPNRLNVALTRAQRKLILVGHIPALQHLPILSRLLTYCRSMKTIFPWQPGDHTQGDPCGRPYNG